jgi:hypothetical protein
MIILSWTLRHSFFQNHHANSFGGNPFVDGIFLGHNLLLSQASRWESLRGWDFSRPQLVVVSGLSVGIPRWMGFRLSGSLAHKLFSFFTMKFWLTGSPFHELILFSRWNFGYHEALHTNFSFFMMEFWLSRSLSHELFFFHDGILAITEPFTRTFLFSWWNSGYQGAFHTNFSFFTMEFWLSLSLSQELFFFHDGILAITEPFTGTFLFSRWNSGYHGAFHTNFLFLWWNFETQNTKRAIWGKTLFIYISERVFT